MKREQGYGMNVSRRVLFCALLMVILSSSCSFPAATQPPVGTIYPTGPAPTVGIPVTGAENVLSLQCAFCVDEEAHAVFILPQSASFLVPDPLAGVTCLTVQVINGRQIVVCRGPQKTLFILNVCVDPINCTQLEITLSQCPLVSQTGVLVLTPLAMFTPTAVNTSTAIPPTAISTQAATQTVAAPPLATPTLSHAVQPTRLSTQQSGTGLQDPAEFVRWYFGTVWTARNYQQLWDNYLTPKFQTTSSPGGFAEYVQWWESVDHATVNAVTVLQNDGTRALVRVNLTFYLKDGRVLANRDYDYVLLYDVSRRTWMFD